MEILDNPAILATLLLAIILPTIYLSIQSLIRQSPDSLAITQLYIYPVKGLRGCALQKAHIGPYGLVGDRTFCLQKVHHDAEGDGSVTKSHKTAYIGQHLRMALFTASIQNGGQLENSEDGQVVISWTGRDTEFASSVPSDSKDEIRFPLSPSVRGLGKLEADIHGSKADAYDMGNEFSQWFTDRLGFEVRLAYIGKESRPVFGSLAPSSKEGVKKARFSDRIRAIAPSLARSPERLVFSDIAHYLVVTEESNDHVSSQFSDGSEMDVTKFRPNIVVKGASGPFVEDYWGELTFDGGLRMPLTSNCFRCQSITVDYRTGKTATGDQGLVWKKLNKNRRVDAGAKYSPVFGRYGYCFAASAGTTLQIGQTATISRVNAQRTIFDWPQLSTLDLAKAK